MSKSVVMYSMKATNSDHSSFRWCLIPDPTCHFVQGLLLERSVALQIPDLCPENSSRYALLDATQANARAEINQS